MTTVKIDDNEFDLDSLSDLAKDHLRSIQFVDSEISKNSALVAVLQTARIAYTKALREALVNQPHDPLAGDTIKLS